MPNVTEDYPGLAARQDDPEIARALSELTTSRALIEHLRYRLGVIRDHLSAALRTVGGPT